MDFEGMTHAQIERLIKELTLYAADKVRTKVWRGTHGEPPKEPHDYVIDAIVALSTGERARNRAKYPSLREQLRSIIDSLVYAEVTRSENRLERRVDDRGEPMVSAPGATRAVDDEVADNELARRIKASVEDQIIEDNELIEVWDVMEKHAEYESADLQRRLGLDKVTADNRRKRFRRVLIKANEEVEGGTYGER